MVNLAKYRLRGMLVLVGLITLLMLGGIGITLVSVQNNIRALEAQKNAHLERDNQILEKIVNVTDFLNKLIQIDLQRTIESLLAFEDNEKTKQTANTNINNIMNEITVLLLDRSEFDYNTTSVLNSGFMNSSLLFQDPPQFNNIINQTDAATVFEKGKSELSVLVRNSNKKANSRRAEFESQISSIDQNIETFNNDLDRTQEDKRQFLKQVSNSTNSTYREDILLSTHLIQGNLTDISQILTEIAHDANSSPLSYQTSSLKTSIENSIENIETTIVSINNSIEAEDTNSFENYWNSSLSTSSLGLSIIDDFSSFQNKYEEVSTIQEDIFLAIESLAENTLTSVEKIIEQQSDSYEQLINQYIQNLRNTLNTWSIRIFSVVGVLLFLVFSYIIYTTSNSIGRIISKHERFSEGDLLVEAREEYPNNEFGVIESSLDNSIQDLHEVLTSVKDTAETLAGISEELAAGSEEASASINQVSSTVREFSAGSSEQNIMLTRVRENLLDHLDVVERTANQIEETANFVLQVAKRTNILGLNASIEAAKAGRFGLGFNVVAEEVRELSVETKESADRIAKSIEEIEQNMQQTVEDTLDEVEIIREVAENTASGSEEASAATSEQVTMMNEISETSAELSDLSQNLNALLQQFQI